MVGAPSLTEKTAASGDGADVTSGPEAGPRHSGKLLVRMPATLHDELARVAEAEGVSLNQLITGALASAVGWRGTGERPASSEAEGEASSPATEPALSPRLTRVALVANLVVLAIAAAAAIALLVAAWQAGF